MNTEELAGIPGWIQREVVERRIPSLFAELASAVQNNANGGRQALEPQRSQLLEAIESVSQNALTDAQARLLNEKIVLLPHLGRRGVEEVEGILFRNSLDAATAAQEINRISSEIQSGVDRGMQIRAALAGLVSPSDLPSDEVLIRIVFDNAASMSNIKDFKKWANEWHDIGRGLAMAVDEAPEDIRIVGAETGSIIITLATTIAIARIASGVILKALEVAEKVQGIRKLELEIQALKLSNDQAALALKNQAEDERRSGLANISELVSAELKLDGEKITALDKSVTKLLAFLEKGGSVDMVLPPALLEGAGDDGAERLTQNVERIRELERDAKLLPHLASNDEPT
jgi:hypothetical protein